MKYTTPLFAMMAILAMLAACSSTGSSTASQNGNTSDAVAQADADDPLICENYIPSGTRIARKVCIRQSERERNQEQAQTITQENQRRSAIGNPVGND
ncbi:hypothetical protein [Congregibacter litoralis]|uniref:Lipoprotein n=1 Tax=Congregibacter litoralis KT71 TaxID=314285 RepID=A4A8C3_9GAMM|nr:hypothetical protein [Congregibacter litoralis]EAQ97918.1 hypothetical protein KT71_15174 [Congregibacter litoralis KT71]